ncbi:hypothetical protein J4G37_17015 [Microvirga sp. 3-52]|nr:hypothetical protein [Microvirga sp. 3-52]
MLHRVITVPARSSSALGSFDVITGLDPVIPTRRARHLPAASWPAQGRP